VEKCQRGLKGWEMHLLIDILKGLDDPGIIWVFLENLHNAIEKGLGVKVVVPM